MRTKNESLISGATSLVIDWTSRALWLGHVGQYSIQLVFTSTPTGTFKLQVSNDEGHPTSQALTEQVVGVTNWTDITGSAQAITASGTHVWDIEGAGHNWVRIVWTASSMTGSLTSARCYTKGF